MMMTIIYRCQKGSSPVSQKGKHVVIIILMEKGRKKEKEACCFIEHFPSWLKKTCCCCMRARDVFYTQVITIKIAWLGFISVAAAEATSLLLCWKKAIFWHGYIYFLCVSGYCTLTAVLLVKKNFLCMSLIWNMYGTEKNERRYKENLFLMALL